MNLLLFVGIGHLLAVALMCVGYATRELLFMATGLALMIVVGVVVVVVDAVETRSRS